MIIDFHTHVYPPALAPRVIGNSNVLGVKNYTEATRDSLLASMKTAGIDMSVVLNIATKPGQFDNVMEFARELRKDSPALIPFGSLHPRDEDWKEELHKIKDAGLLGVKLHPDYQGFYIDDPFLEPLYREVAALGLILVFHAGHDVVSPDDVHASVSRIVNIAPLLELGTTVLAHMGGMLQWEECRDLLCGRNLYLDTSYSLYPETIDVTRDIVRKHGPERILFGSDSPWHDQKDDVNFFRGVFAKGFLSDADKQAILGGNGLRLLGRPAYCNCNK